MATCSRPLVSVQGDGGATEVPMPAVFVAPIRADIVRTVHTNMAKNHRQAYSVNKDAGMQSSAESWGTGRAVSRIPRVPGGGTHRAGQGAFGNMCRGGRMFAPTRVWRKWHVQSNLTERRQAVCASLAASALPSLVQARGHRIDEVPEMPLVVANEAENTGKTKDAVALLKSVGAYADVEKVKDSKNIRRGKGKMRNRRHVQRRGPLVVYNEDNGLSKALRNLPGVESVNVERLNLLNLAPGGHVGRFIIWTQGAFSRLNEIYGTFNKKSQRKSGFSIPYPVMTNPDVNRLINSDEIQQVVRPTIKTAKYAARKKNPLKNLGAMVKLNPHALTQRRAALRAAEKSAAARQAKADANRKGLKAKSKLSTKEKKAKRSYSKAGFAFHAKISAPVH